MARNNPINLRGNSFACFDDAMDMCELLARETGEKYTVMSDSQLGFTAKKIGSNNSSLNSRENNDAGHSRFVGRTETNTIHFV